MVKTKTMKSPDGKMKTVVPLEDIKEAYCEFCDAIMEVDQDGTCMECARPIAYPAIPFEETKFTKE